MQYVQLFHDDVESVGTTTLLLPEQQVIPPDEPQRRSHCLCLALGCCVEGGQGWVTGREGERGKDGGMGNERERKREREREAGSSIATCYTLLQIPGRIL